MGATLAAVLALLNPSVVLFTLGSSTAANVKFVIVAGAGFNFSVVNRRKTGEFTVFGRYRKVVYRCFSVFFVSNFKISKKFINNRKKNRQKL